MKKLLIILFLVASASVWAQDFNERIAIPLSSPGNKGKLEVGLVRGDIMVEAYDGKEVIIEAEASTKSKDDDCASCDDDDDRDDRSVPSGMKRIASSPIELSASENNNRVKIETNSWKKPINLTIKVPANFDLEISTVHGQIDVTGVSGTHEISAVHGPLTLKNMSGSIVSNTVHGDIIVNFLKVTPNEPMSFVTLHGNVDVTFPPGIKATAKMRSDRGEIFTDYDMTVDRSKPEVKSDDGKYKVSINSWVFGAINGGGPEYTFKNMHGDIIIRKK
ncbi:DUF4097 family beta strand repeat-containing protein [Ekhidna sp.]|uniref:DUF4097 family beta strand repeat-containing protein n=1 Tax=Ekhidna sp. TaxID=2608089 RepID=UPI0032998AAB